MLGLENADPVPGPESPTESPVTSFRLPRKSTDEKAVDKTVEPKIDLNDKMVEENENFATPRLPVPDLLKPVSHLRKPRTAVESERATRSQPVPFLEQADLPEHTDLLPKPTRSEVEPTVPVIKLTINSQQEFVAPEQPNWKERLENANLDRKVLARFFALCLCFVAIVNMVPALYQWYQWTQLTESMPLPRWIYILVFVGAIHFVYAIFLFQINDWSAMRAVSLAMLVVAFVFGCISTGLLIGNGQGNLTTFLGLPFALNRQACIWCVAMLCLATLMSFWGGKESANWQRAEQLLRDIVARAG